MRFRMCDLIVKGPKKFAIGKGAGRMLKMDEAEDGRAATCAGPGALSRSLFSGVCSHSRDLRDSICGS